MNPTEMTETTYMRYWTPRYIVRISVDSVNRYWRASTNDFDFYHKYINKLECKPKEEAQADLDAIAEKVGLQEAGTEKPYSARRSKIALGSAGDSPPSTTDPLEEE